MKASKKATPNLPASSRMQMPMTGTKVVGKMTKTAGGSKGATKKVMIMAKKGGK